MTTPDSQSPAAPHPESPVHDLRAILAEAGEDTAQLFSAALNIYAGPRASSQSDQNKAADLERIILNPPHRRPPMES